MLTDHTLWPRAGLLRSAYVIIQSINRRWRNPAWPSSCVTPADASTKVLRGPVGFEELSCLFAVGLTDSKEGSPPTCFSYFLVRPATLHCFVYFQVNNVVWSFLDYVEDIICRSPSPPFFESLTQTFFGAIVNTSSIPHYRSHDPWM